MRTVLVDERISAECYSSLQRCGFNVITLPKNPSLPEAIASHPDSLMFRYGDRLITTADYCDRAAYIFSDLREYYPALKICFTADTLGKRYPDDCRFNALTVGKNLVCRSESISEAILRMAEKNGLSVVNSRQGYPACTTLLIDEGNAVTSDEGMARLLTSLSVSVSLISAGGISLPPYEYGFIGGASFVCGDSVYFFGDPLLHPDGEKIAEAVLRAGKRIVALSSAPLADIGGALVFE